jgi:hypothetical protein
VELEWKFLQDKSTNWKKIAAIDERRNRSLFSNNTDYQDRLTIHPNGSLMIASLKPDDETKYLCRVKPTNGSRKHFMIQLNVTCNGEFAWDEMVAGIAGIYGV